MRILQKLKATLLITIFSLFFGYGQDTIDIKEIYINDGLAYKVANDRIFTGVAQKQEKMVMLFLKSFMIMVKYFLILPISISEKKNHPVRQFITYPKSLFLKRESNIYQINMGNGKK